MSLRIQSLPPNLLPQPTKFQFQLHPFSAPIKIAKHNSRTLAISCSKEKENLTDEILSVELGLQIKKLKSDVVQREEALKKSRELLFTEMCGFMGLESEEDLKKKWRKMNEDERLVLVRGFVAEWSAHYHPLSATSVKEMVQQYVQDQNDEFSDSVSGKLFSDFTKFLGFSGNSEES